MGLFIMKRRFHNEKGVFIMKIGSDVWYTVGMKKIDDKFWSVSQRSEDGCVGC